MQSLRVPLRPHGSPARRQFLLDFFNINRHVQVRGWRFEGLVVVRDGVVLFRNSAGEAKLDATERTINPLGPFQRSGESSDLLLR